MPSLIAQVVRFVDDEPQPGIVECLLVDASGQSHLFLEKTAVVSNETLVGASCYPAPGHLACEIEAEWRDEKGNELASVCTEQPWGISSTAGMIRFVVHSSQIVREPY